MSTPIAPFGNNDAPQVETAPLGDGGFALWESQAGDGILFADDTPSSNRRTRTQHGEQRHSEGDRPTAQVWQDAEAAIQGRVFIDDRTGNWVVQGTNQRDRIHFITPEGQHQSSMVNSQSNTRDRIQRGRWRSVTEQEFNEFKELIGS